jgi:hypothetical protein
MNVADSKKSDVPVIVLRIFTVSEKSLNYHIWLARMVKESGHIAKFQSVVKIYLAFVHVQHFIVLQEEVVQAKEVHVVLAMAFLFGD